MSLFIYQLTLVIDESEGGGLDGCDLVPEEIKLPGTRRDGEAAGRDRRERVFIKAEHAEVGDTRERCCDSNGIW